MTRTYMPLLVLLVALPASAAESAADGASWRAWLHVVADVIKIAAVLVMLWGFGRAVYSFVRSELRGGGAGERTALRSGLGYFILLGLEFLIVADVVETIIVPDIEHLIILGLTVVIRTVISFSLNWELAQEAKHQRSTHR